MVNAAATKRIYAVNARTRVRADAGTTPPELPPGPADYDALQKTADELVRACKRPGGGGASRTTIYAVIDGLKKLRATVDPASKGDEDANAVAAAVKEAFKIVRDTTPHLRTSRNPHGLSDREIAKCKAKGVDPARYAAMKARSSS